MGTLGISRNEKRISRAVFYLLVLFVLWGTNLLVPDFQALEARRWEDRGVARPYIAVSAAEWEAILAREGRVGE
ncbi:MAG: hypothetical protein GXX91_16020 [Verrucomicrobiaceae bacterium]|nr:hypothetical protein [Verrucomicrobiaceae bacterium]